MSGEKMKRKLRLKNKKPMVELLKSFNFDTGRVEFHWNVWMNDNGKSVVVSARNLQHAMKKLKSRWPKIYWTMCNEAPTWKAFPPAWMYERVL